jgi:hypothetical protein
MKDDVNPHRIIIDLTNSNSVPDLYESWVKAGMHGTKFT